MKKQTIRLASDMQEHVDFLESAIKTCNVGFNYNTNSTVSAATKSRFKSLFTLQLNDQAKIFVYNEIMLISNLIEKLNDDNALEVYHEFQEYLQIKNLPRTENPFEEDSAVESDEDDEDGEDDEDDAPAQKRKSKIPPAPIKKAMPDTNCPYKHHFGLDFADHDDCELCESAFPKTYSDCEDV